MSTPPPFLPSSQATLTPSRRRRSAFTYKHLLQLSQYSTSCPLRVIAHIDLDAFYAQCEGVRLGLPPTTPLAVQQWQGLIAINYPARAYGLSRHVTCTEAKRACPEIVLQHVATWKEGEDKWAYREDAAAGIAVQKVSLDPYRLESRRILGVIKEWLPGDKQRVEKASIDEVFVDLSAQVHAVLLERYPVLSGPAPYDDLTECLPRPESTVIDWATDALVDLDEGKTEEEDPDWDDVVMGIASEIVRGLRGEVFEKLKYTCSAGVAKNKMLAKLGSGHKKPNQQTIVRNRAIQQFLSGFKFTKIRNLGGKLGDEVVAAFNTDTVLELLEVSMEQMKKQLGDGTGSWLYNVIRGEDQSEVNPRTQIKSMLSAKSFRPSINSFEVACKWLRIFVGDIFSRLVEEGVLNNKRRPKTINLHHRQGGQMRSKQAPIPSGKAIDEGMLFDLAKNLLAQVVVDGRAWPCANLSLSVGGFEDGIKDNKGISTFLLRGDEAKAMNETNMATSNRDDTTTPPPGKRRKIDDGKLRSFFGAVRQESSGQSGDNDDHDTYDINEHPDEGHMAEDDDDFAPPQSAQPQAETEQDYAKVTKTHPLPEPTTDMTRYTCQKCNRSILVEDRGEHDDWHFARQLQREESTPSEAPPTPHTAKPRPVQVQHKGRGRGRPPNQGLGRSEKGQSKLAFG